METTAEPYGHEPVVRPRLGRRGPELAAIWDEIPASISVADIADLVGPLYTMDVHIRSLWANPNRLVGRALTVKAWPADNLSIHGALALAKESDVLVVDWRGTTAACGGGYHIAMQARERGLRGIIIDGAWRDLEALASAGFPIFGRGECSYSPPKKRAGEIGVPVNCGGVVVEPGDVVFADAAGVAIVPSSYSSVLAAQIISQNAERRTGASTTSDGRLAAYRRAYEAATGGVPSEWS
jgi:4-hydroxy-4-methyl-2-oxoglutarate aldolase